MSRKKKQIDIVAGIDAAAAIISGEPATPELVAAGLALKETEGYGKWTEKMVKVLEEKASSLVDHITIEKMKKSSARDLAYSADVIIKNKRLLAGESTEIIDEKIPDAQIAKVIENIPSEFLAT